MSQMRNDFDHIIKLYGHDVLLQRRKQDPSLDKPEFEEKLERHTTRHMLPTTRGLPTVAQEEMEGIVNTAEKLYFFKHDVFPFEGDRIYEYDEESKRVGQIIWKIDSAVAMRGLGGKIVYWIVGVTRERPN